MWRENDVHQAHVTGVGHDARVEERIRGQRAVGPEPIALAGFLRSQRTPGHLANETLIDRVLALEPLVGVGAPFFQSFVERKNGLGSGHVGHLELVLEAEFVGMETGLQIVDRATMLDGDHSTGGETATVANPVNFVKNRCCRIAGSKKVGMERMHPTLGDRSTRRHEGLCSDLATEGALTLFFGVLSAVRVDLNDLEVEKFDKEFKGFGHLSIVTLATGEAFKGAN
jgi:hypothetical protein